MAISIDMVYDRDRIIDYLKENNNETELDFTVRTYGHKYIYSIATIAPTKNHEPKNIKGIFGIAFDKTAQVQSYKVNKIILKLADNNLILFFNDEKYTEGNNMFSLGFNEFCFVDTERTKDFASFAMRF